MFLLYVIRYLLTVAKAKTILNMKKLLLAKVCSQVKSFSEVITLFLLIVLLLVQLLVTI